MREDFDSLLPSSLDGLLKAPYSQNSIQLFKQNKCIVCTSCDNTVFLYYMFYKVSGVYGDITNLHETCVKMYTNNTLIRKLTTKEIFYLEIHA